MNDRQGKNDLATLRGIVRGPGNYATPSPERIQRLIKRGWVKRNLGALRPTLKGRLVALISGLKQVG
jgi:hypothetical protein